MLVNDSLNNRLGPVVAGILTSALALASPGCRPVEPAGSSSNTTGSVSDTTAEPSGDNSAARTAPAAGEPTTPSTPTDAGEMPSTAEQIVSALPADAVKLVAVEIKLPAPAFRGTPVPLNEPNVEPPRGGPRPPFLAPEGTANLALKKPVASSDPVPAGGELDYVNDGDKEASDFGYLELRPGTEWVQVDLGQRATIYGVVLWHNHAEARVYRDVIVQVSDDPDFLDGQTVYNNDYDNSSGMGIGQDKGYVETSEGKLIDCKGVQGRYVRFYSRGSHIDEKNHYTELEVYGRPAA